MSLRTEYEKAEKQFICSSGCPSIESKGRVKFEVPCDIRTEFQKDKDRIVFSNSFRRLKHKTQVFLSPMGDHYRTRLTHTLEVSQIARTIARSLRLNEDLAEAIALAHDLGHPPFGHSGETALKEIYSNSFSHRKQSIRVVDILEKNGKGLNLTFEVRDGILKHSKGFGKIIPDDPKELPATFEGRVVRIADIMAYLNHDLDDAIRSKVITKDQIPKACVKVLGNTHSKRVSSMIKDIVVSSMSSYDSGFQINISNKMYTAMSDLRSFLYDNVYRSDQVHKEFVKAKKLLSELFVYFIENRDRLESELIIMELPVNNSNAKTKRVVCDFIASLTDRYALKLYEDIFFPSPLV